MNYGNNSLDSIPQHPIADTLWISRILHIRGGILDLSTIICRAKLLRSFAAKDHGDYEQLCSIGSTTIYFHGHHVREVRLGGADVRYHGFAL